MLLKNPDSNLINPSSIKSEFAASFVFLVIVFGCSAQIVWCQKTAVKAKQPVVATNKVKTEKKAATDTETVVKPQIASRIEVKPSDNPPLLTLVVGQVTTIKLPEAPLQIEGDRLGLSISESNENSINKNVYIIPTKTGIRRNLVIELASGKVEFELQSVGVENGKTAVFTREVDVKSVSGEKRRESLEGEVKNLKDALANKEREIAATTDRIAQAAQTAQLPELKLQAEMLLALAKQKKGRQQTSATKEWTVTEVYRAKMSDGARVMSIYEIKFRGKGDGKFLDVKSDAGARIYWQPEVSATENQGAALLVKRGGRIKVAVIEFVGGTASRGLVFALEGDVVKF